MVVGGASSKLNYIIKQCNHVNGNIFFEGKERQSINRYKLFIKIKILADCGLLTSTNIFFWRSTF